MNQIRNLFLLSVTVLIYVSCSTMKNSIQKNRKYTEKIVSSLYEENGNVFYLQSSYSTFSTVWTYGKTQIEVYKISKGKIYNREKYNGTNQTLKLVPTFNEIHIELKECGYELDGDIFGFKIINGSEVEQQDLPISIDCFTKLKYKSEFLNKIVKDINTYKLWNVQYE